MTPEPERDVLAGLKPVAYWRRATLGSRQFRDGRLDHTPQPGNPWHPMYDAANVRARITDLTERLEEAERFAITRAQESRDWGVKPGELCDDCRDLALRRALTETKHGTPPPEPSEPRVEARYLGRKKPRSPEPFRPADPSRVTFDGCGHTLLADDVDFDPTGSNVAGCCPDCATPEPTVEGEDLWEPTETEMSGIQRAFPFYNRKGLLFAWRYAADRLRARIAPEITRLRDEVERLRGRMKEIRECGLDIRRPAVGRVIDMRNAADRALDPQPQEETEDVI